MEGSKLTQEQENSKNEAILQGVAFEQVAGTEGFKYIKAYYETKLKTFVNEVFNHEEKPIQEFESERQQLLGLKKLFSEIEFSLKELERVRKDAKSTEPTE